MAKPYLQPFRPSSRIAVYLRFECGVDDLEDRIADQFDACNSVLEPDWGKQQLHYTYYIDRNHAVEEGLGPALQQLLKDLDKKQVSFLFIHRFDRLGSTSRQVADVLEKLLSRKVVCWTAAAERRIDAEKVLKRLRRRGICAAFLSSLPDKPCGKQGRGWLVAADPAELSRETPSDL